MADVVSWVSKPCRCLFHITPVIPNCHFIPSSLLFFIHNSQLALIGDFFSSGVTTQQPQNTPPGIKHLIKLKISNFLYTVLLNDFISFVFCLN